MQAQVQQSQACKADPFTQLNNKISSFVLSIDQSILIIENQQSQIHELKAKHDAFFHSKSCHYNSNIVNHSQLKIIASFLIQEKIKKLSKDLTKIIDEIFQAELTKIQTLLKDLIQESIKIYSVFENDTPFETIYQILRTSFDSDFYQLGFNKNQINSTSKNMTFVQYNQIESKDLKTLKQQQNDLLDKIVSIKKLIFLLEKQKTNLSQKMQSQSPNQTQTKEKESPQNAYLQLFNFYQNLLNLNQFKCLVPKLIYPVLLPQTQSTLIPQLNQDQIQKLPQNNHKMNSIEFKIEARGFSSSKTVQTQSIKEKLQSKAQKNPSNDLFLQFQQDLIKIDEHRNQKEQEKFFEFGFIDASCAHQFLHQSFFVKTEIQENNLIKDPALQNILSTQSQSNQSTKIDQFSVKIVNLENNFFIKSQKQAKLIKLDPRWEHFQLKVLYSILSNKKPQIQLCGLIRKSKTKLQKSDSIQVSSPFKEEVILKYSLSPSMCGKVLRPFFKFKNFQCTIHIKNF